MPRQVILLSWAKVSDAHFSSLISKGQFETHDPVSAFISICCLLLTPIYNQKQYSNLILHVRRNGAKRLDARWDEETFASDARFVRAGGWQTRGKETGIRQQASWTQEMNWNFIMWQNEVSNRKQIILWLLYLLDLPKTEGRSTVEAIRP